MTEMVLAICAASSSTSVVVTCSIGAGRLSVDSISSIFTACSKGKAMMGLCGFEDIRRCVFSRVKIWTVRLMRGRKGQLAGPLC